MRRVDGRFRRILEIGGIGVLVALLAAPAALPRADVARRAGAESRSGGELLVSYACPAGPANATFDASAEPTSVADGGTVALTLAMALPRAPVAVGGGDVWVAYPLPEQVAAVRAVTFAETGGVAAPAWFADADSLTIVLTPAQGPDSLAATAVATVLLRSGVAPATVTFTAPVRLTLVPPTDEGATPTVCTVGGSPPTLVSVAVVESPPPSTVPPSGSTTTTSTTTPSGPSSTTTSTVPPDPAAGGDAPSPPPVAAADIPELPPSPDPAAASRVMTADLDGAEARLEAARDSLAASTVRLDALRRQSRRVQADERGLEAERDRLSTKVELARGEVTQRATEAYIAAVDAHASLGAADREVALMATVLEGGVANYNRLLARRSEVIDELAGTGATRAERQDRLDSAATERRDLQSQVGDGRYQLATFEGGGDLAVSGFQFVVGGDHNFTDTWHAPRSGGRQHQGTDIFAPEGTPLYAAERGVLARVGTDTLGGTKLWLVGESGTQYYYAHLSAYADGVADGVVVGSGQVIGYVGHTGNAATTPSHLHFEVHPGGGDAIDAYPMLVAADTGNTVTSPATPTGDASTTTTTTTTTITTPPSTSSTATTPPTEPADPSSDGRPATGDRPRFVRSWGSSGAADSAFDHPSGVAVGGDGSVYVADSGNDRIQRFRADGTFVGTWGAAGGLDGQFHHPAGVAVGGDGSVYVADSGNNRIQQFTAAGRFVTAWGATGAREGQFNEPSGVAVSPDGTVFVADTLNNRIQAFDGSGEFLDSWGRSGVGDSQFANPYGVAVDGAGDVYVADTFNGRIQRFTGEGTFVAAWGDGAELGGRLHRPGALAVTRHGVVVADKAHRSIRQYDPTGAFVRAWGGQGHGDGQLVRPTGLAAGPSGRLYVVDTGNDRVQQFALPTTRPVP